MIKGIGRYDNVTLMLSVSLITEELKPMSDPLYDLAQLIGGIKPLNLPGSTTKRTDSQERKEDLRDYGLWLAACQRRTDPVLKDVHIALLVSSYEGSSQSDEAQKWLEVVRRGQSPLNQLCVPWGLGLRVFEMAPQIPHETGKYNSWSRRDAAAAAAFGMEATAAEGDLLPLGAVAPGGRLSAVALLRKLLGDVSHIDALTNTEKEKLETLMALIPRGDDIIPLDVLHKLGGREVAGLLGAMIAAYNAKQAVVIEGWSALAALAVLKAVNPDAGDHVRLAALTDPLQSEFAVKMGLVPLVGPVVSAGRGCGLALACGLLSGGLKCLG